MSNDTFKNIDFQVRRDDLAVCESIENSLAQPGPGQIAVKIDAFALTANNVTYALLGDSLKYWSFFPGTEGFGRIPAWGFARVIASNHDGIAPGERLYGYWPMSSGLVMQPERVSPGGFTDGIAHRKGLPGLYNSYARTTEDPFYSPDYEELHMVLYPLFGTSFLLGDLLRDGNPPEASRVVFSSASAKTAFSTACMLKDTKACMLKDTNLKVIGMTSPRNKEFTAGLGVYDEVIVYDDIQSLAKGDPMAYVDFAGNGRVTRELHEHFGEQLVYSLGVGSSHPGKLEKDEGEALPGAAREMFFAPMYSRKRMKALGGPRGMATAMAERWKEYRVIASDWINIHRGEGPEEVRRVYLDMLQGRAKPDQGYVLSL